jgi:transposase
MRLTASQLAALLDGMDWSRLHARDVAQPYGDVVSAATF